MRVLALALFGASGAAGILPASPELPAISDVLEPASSTIAQVKAQISALSARVADLQQSQKQRLSHKRSDLEAQLAEEEAETEAAEAENRILFRRILRQ